MCFRISILFFSLVVAQTSFAVRCENLILDDFNFSYEGNEIQVSLRNESKQKLDVEFIKNKNSKNISGTIQVKNNEKNLCFEKDIDIPPIKLCKDADNNIEEWRFVTYGLTDVLSVVSLTADVKDERTILFNSRICNFAKVKGRVYIQDSHLKGGDIEGLANTTTSPGTPEFPPYPELPPIPIPEDEKKVHLKNKKLDFSYFTVKLVNVEIAGNPTIKGSGKGITIEDSILNDSPKFTGEISIKNSFVTNNGNYKGVAEAWGQDYFIPLIRNNLSGNNNNISGIYYLRRKIIDSVISGEISRKQNGDLDMVAHIGEHGTDFVESYFYGFGHVGGETDINTFIHGYYVHPVTHGVLFETGSAINSATITGAIWIEGSTIDDAETNGTASHDGEDKVMHITGSTITTSEVYGSGRIRSSTIYSSYITGQPYINAYLAYSTVSCNAIVDGSFSGLVAGCGYGHPPLKKEKDKRAEDIVNKVMTSYREDILRTWSQIVAYESNAYGLHKEKLKMKRRK